MVDFVRFCFVFQFCFFGFDRAVTMETINQVTVNLPQDDYFSPTDFRLAKTTKSDISYRVFTSEYTSSACDHSVLPKFEADVPVKFLIHGWTTNETSPWYDLLKSAYFRKGAHRVVFVDWSVAGTKKYSVSAANSKPIGEYLGDFIVDSGVSLGLVHLVGHSLGSHVASFAGKRVLKRTGKKVGRITALDPALPKFEGAPAECGLHVEDAEFVDVVHTDVGHYGYTRPAGHVDFYPNGGKDQPGCPSLEVDDNCSHARSTLFFVESVNSKDFVARRADSWQDYLAGNYSNEESVVFGEDTPTETRGVYYFRTNAQSPYAMGEKKTG